MEHATLLKISRFIALAGVAAMFLAGCTPTSSEQESGSDPLVFVGVPVDESQDIAESYRLMMNLISEATGRDVEFYQSQDYGTSTEALIAGKVDVSLLSVFSYVLATSRTESIELLGTVARDGGDLPGAYAYGIKGAGDASIQDLEDLRGKTVCYSDPGSGVGYFWPAYSMDEVGIDFDPVESKDYKAVFAGTFPQVAANVSNGDCDAGFLLDAIYDTALPNSDLVDMDSIEKFWTSPVLPGLALVVNSDAISEADAEKIKQKMLTLGNKTALVAEGICESEGECAFLSSAAWGFVESTDSFYDPLRELCGRLEIEQCSK
ncbi:MAG: phosphate/phosphite/phosphonate ABC transporter substrate-binding protein [Aquiluna sp.]|nr:phosphate/phosphite/phosphonate ABC transporter substrate-binding protein [Aquiluna sp.]MCF8546177.1 phosphate/phosphite/phosphonate ABC transporter substrate-binding protein [Aquiluna sp.]